MAGRCSVRSAQSHWRCAILIFYLFPLVATVILGICSWEKLFNEKTSSSDRRCLCRPYSRARPARGVVSPYGGGDTSFHGRSSALAWSPLCPPRVLRAGDSRPVTLYLATVSAVLLIAFCIMRAIFVLPDTDNRLGQIWRASRTLHLCHHLVLHFPSTIVGPTRSSLLSFPQPLITTPPPHPFAQGSPSTLVASLQIPSCRRRFY